MCGIFGVYETSGADPGVVQRALEKMHHRGPDARGTWRSADGRLALGHARLKIIDLSDGANQPLVSSDGRWVLSFNGEIVNYRGVKAAYRGPWQFRTNGDSEVLLATFARDGLTAMSTWVGMFAFAIVDTTRNVLTLVRDRFGIKPLYLAETRSGGFAFASEIQPLLPLLARVAPDEDVIRTYLEIGLYDHTPRSFFSGVTALGPGTALELDLDTGRRRTVRWYDLAAAIPDLSGAGEPELIEEGARRIETAIGDHLVADVRVGLNVSGGVDSSVLVALAKRSVKDIHLFTQDYEPPYSEAHWVREVAGECPIHFMSLGSTSIRERLDATVHQQAEPFGGITVCGYDALYEAASREGVTVLLDGNGVDEAFLGYSKYHALHVASAPSERVRQERAEGYAGFWGQRPAAFGRDPAVGRSIDGSVGVRPEAIASRLLAESRLLGPEGCSISSVVDPVKQEALTDLLATKIPRGLRFNDRVSMRWSRELRVPFLDHRVVEFGIGVPTGHLLGARGSKLLFRKIAAHSVANNVAFAAKRSVQSPQREWLAGPWRDLVAHILRSSTLAERGWIDPVLAHSLHEDYCNRTADNSFFIWQWINLELWARRFLP